jgi:sporulation protein YlmC with PRC-barrel domain
MRGLPIAAILAGLLAGPALVLAQPAPSPLLRVEAGQILAKDVMGRSVYSNDGMEIGDVKDLILDPAQGRILLVVIGLDGRLGFTERYVAVPLDRLRYVPGERRVTINMAVTEIQELPGMDY